MEHNEQLTAAAGDAADSISDTVMAEHRDTMAKMRTAYALEQLYAASGARDPGDLACLIEIGDGDIVIGEDGVPDVTAVRAKIDGLRRTKAYLFNAPTASSAAADDRSQTAAQAMRLGVLAAADPAAMDDAAYYRAFYARRNHRRGSR